MPRHPFMTQATKQMIEQVTSALATPKMAEAEIALGVHECRGNLPEGTSKSFTAHVAGARAILRELLDAKAPASQGTITEGDEK